MMRLGSLRIVPGLVAGEKNECRCSGVGYVRRRTEVLAMLPQ
jgi:hypothetical protein